MLGYLFIESEFINSIKFVIRFLQYNRGNILVSQRRRYIYENYYHYSYLININKARQPNFHQTLQTKSIIKKMIKQLSKQVTEDLCAQQVITSICDCVKELIDNSIDAQSTKIQIILEQYGKALIRVRDNGSGIESFQFLAKKGSTSKNKGNYQQVNTLGFRGEALHSIGKVSRKMVITSTTEGNKTKQFDVRAQKQTTISQMRQKGTTVQIQSLFEYLPVRRYQLQNKFKQFFKKIDDMLKEYCLIYPKVSFVLKNIRDRNQDLILETSSHNSGNQQQNWLGRVEQVLGLKISSNLIYLNTSHLCGWILKNIQSGSSRQNTFIRKNLYYMYLNNRPINPLPKLVVILDENYKKYNKSTKYMFIINILLPWDSYDVNLTPNKRQILIKQSLVIMIIAELRNFIEKNVIQSIPVLQDYEEKKPKQRISNFVSNDGCCRGSEQDKKQKRKLDHTEQANNRMNQMKKQVEKVQVNKQKIKKQQVNIKQKLMPENQSKDINQSKSKLIQSLNQRMSVGNKKIITTHPVRKEEQQKPKNQVKIQPQIQIKPFRKDSDDSTPKQIAQKQKKIQNSNQIGSDRITHNIEKQSFKQFKILGQFNHGFIVCYYNDKQNKSFYLVDQHAASQKFHFQSLMKSIPNKSQVCDQIHVSPIDVDLMEENKQDLHQDGFKFQIQARDQVTLLQVPVFLDKKYGKQYFLELVSTKKRLSEHPDYYSAAATKACRTAVMVGDVLQHSQMKGIVYQLANLNSPWNCPHGRPTLIYLGQKQQIQKEMSINKREYSLL